ncbi:hypothetical protein WN51_11628 [Melipona quadrifasciata]|uniref:Uncharacterized protein n=1 Tax=Melipona quadrifasciata TaxID=166423 RepID=A0A0M9A377_9HYME|nr:hypothetical protein WN51_11628 [Melipona quadrifasciata]
MEQKLSETNKIYETAKINLLDSKTWKMTLKFSIITSYSILLWKFCHKARLLQDVLSYDKKIYYKRRLRNRKEINRSEALLSKKRLIFDLTLEKKLGDC